ncbi:MULTISPECIES: hypothetical protein [Streptomyces]|nr:MULTISPECIES: hypothetical protein [Streptomyces]GHF24393.1 hypothetical protein GCM10010359_28310 [Streptomyces morookaense]
MATAFVAAADAFDAEGAAVEAEGAAFELIEVEGATDEGVAEGP